MSWLDSLLVAALDNALGATVLAGVVFLVTRWWRNPLVVHALWLLVLVKLVAPPIVPLHWGMSSASLLRLPSAAGPAAVEQDLVLPDEPPVAASAAASENTVENARAAEAPLRVVEPAPPVIDSPPETLVVAPSPPAEQITATEAPIAVSEPVESPISAPPPALAPPTEIPVAQPWRWRSVVTLVWLLGSAAYLVLAGVRIARFQRSLAALPAADERVQRLAREVGQKLGYRGSLVVRVAPGRTPPLLWAVGRPTILLPNELLATLGESELAGILAHELAHLVRRDPWVRWFELLVVGLYWWHPVAWGARRALRDSEELACDALVLDRLGTGPEAYVRGLLQALDLATGASGPSLASSLGRKGSLHRRVEAMLARRYAPRLSWAAGMMIGLVAVAFVPLSMRASRGEEAPPNEPVAAATSETAKEGAEDSASSTAAAEEQKETSQEDLDPRLGPGEWVDPQVREYLRNYMLRPEWPQPTAIKGRVVDAQGDAAANVDVMAQTNLFGTIAVAKTNERGEFEVSSADSNPALIATSNDGALSGYFRAPQAEAERPAQPYVVKLGPPREIDAHVVDGQGQPVSAAIVTAIFGDGLTAVATTDEQGRGKLRVPQAAPLEAVFARKDNVGLDIVTFDQEGKPERDVAASPFEFTLKGARTITVRAIDGRNGKPGPSALASYRLSRNGKNHLLHSLAELHQFVGADGAASFSFAPLDEPSSVNVRAFDASLFAENFGYISFDPQRSGNEYTLEFWPRVKLAGQVRFADGRPAPGLPVLVAGGQRGDAGRPSSATTDAAGKFELEVDANDYYLLAAGDKQWAAPVKTLVIGHESPPPVDLTLGPAVRVVGRDPDLRRIVLTQHAPTAYEALPRSELLPLRLTPFPMRTQLQRTGETDADGKYEFYVGPGTYSVEGPQGVSRATTPRFTLTDEKEYDVDRGAPGAASARVKVRIVRADDHQVGLERARYYIHRFDRQPPEGKRAGADGVAEVDSLGSRFVVEAQDDDQKLVGMVESKPGETELIVPLGPPAVVRGRLIDRAGRRFSGRVDYRAVQGNNVIHAGGNPSVSHGQAKIGDDGRFVLDKLAPGWTYSLSASLNYPDEPRQGRYKHAWLGTAETASAPVDLGDLTIEPAY